MKFLIATGFVAALSSAATGLSSLAAYSFSETSVLLVWGGALLVIGRQVRARQTGERRITAAPAPRVRAARHELEAGVRA